jgi:hypothetical protein
LKSGFNLTDQPYRGRASALDNCDSSAFLIAGVLLLGGAVVIISGAQTPIRLSAEPGGRIGDRAAKAI